MKLDIALGMMAVLGVYAVWPDPIDVAVCSFVAGNAFAFAFAHWLVRRELEKFGNPDK